MQLVRRYRIPALFCALAVLFCELLSRPYANMGICDEAPYYVMAQHLASTGHFVYNGWGSPMIGWQLYLGAAFLRLFGYSYTAIRMSTLLVAVLMAFVLQRTMVRAAIRERNATIGTLAFVLSPLYLKLSVTYMSDILGLFAVVVCLYGCLRALQARSDRATIAWLCFALVSNAILGTARQIEWLGILVMLPSAVWLLRARRRVFIVGCALTIAGGLFVFACMQWLKYQPYLVPAHLELHRGQELDVLAALFEAVLEIPFLLLPIAILFIPEVRRDIRRSVLLVAGTSVFYLLLQYAMRWRHIPRPLVLLEPTLGDWITKYAIFQGPHDIKGPLPIFLPLGVRVLLTVASLGGLLGLLAPPFRPAPETPSATSGASTSWRQFGVLLAPFAIAYALVLVPRSAIWIGDRYLIPLLVVVLLFMVRYYQDRIRPQLPRASSIVVAIMAVYGITVTHEMFAFARARAALAAELRAAGVPETSVNNGWEYNLGTELQHAAYINARAIEVPANAYVPAPLPRPGSCEMLFYDATPHIHPTYGVSFSPNACYGPAPFAPVHYSRWPYRTPGTLYVVRYLPPSKP